MCHAAQDVSIKTLDDSIVCLAQPGGALCDYVKHRLDVCRRAGDNAQYFARGSLLLQSFLEFLEQPDVFDRDNGLVCKCSYEIDLFIGKTIDSVPPKDKHSDHNAVSQERHPQQAAVTFNTLLL